MGKFSKLAVALVTVGAMLATLGAMLKFYAYDKLAVIPLDHATESVIIGPNASFFDADIVAPNSGDITTTARVLGDPKLSKEASEETDTNAIVINMSQSTDNNGEAPPMDYTERTVALDRFTGAPVAWSGNEQDGELTDFKGQVIKWPFNTQKKDYQYWDGTLLKPVTMKYEGIETVKGSKDSMSTYKFHVSIPESTTTTREVPRGIFGLEDTGAVIADRTYANDRTIWVDPETGVMIKIQEIQLQRLLLNEPGANPVTALSTTSVTSPRSIDENIEEYKSKSASLKAVRTFLPLVLGGIGALLLIAGFGLAWSYAKRNDENDSAEVAKRFRD